MKTTQYMEPNASLYRDLPANQSDFFNTHRPYHKLAPSVSLSAKAD